MSSKKIHVFTGLKPGLYVNTPWLALLDESACYRELAAKLHPGGLRCGKCGSAESIKWGSTASGFPVHKCRACSAKYNLLTGTPLSGSTLGARHIVLFMRLWGQGYRAQDIAPHVGLHSTSIASLKRKLTVYAAAAAGGQE